jgi:hypothetical protein
MVYPRKGSLVISPFPSSGHYDLTTATRVSSALVNAATTSRVAQLIGVTEEELRKRMEGTQ